MIGPTSLCILSLNDWFVDTEKTIHDLICLLRMLVKLRAQFTFEGIEHILMPPQLQRHQLAIVHLILRRIVFQDFLTDSRGFR